MKDFNIELVADVKYAKGTRLILKIKKEAYLGTVTATRMGEVYLLLDNGEKVKVKEKSKLILGEGIKRKVKKGVPLDDFSLFKNAMSAKKGVTQEKLIAVNTKNIKNIVQKEIERLGNNADLNHIDVSKVTDFSFVFENSAFKGDISNWDVSKAKKMTGLFENSAFNGDISNWDVSNVTNMQAMFSSSVFKGDISNWDVSKVTDFSFMFENSAFNGDISNWNVSKAITFEDMFKNSKFNGDLNKWEINKKAKYLETIFNNSPLAKKLPVWIKPTKVDFTPAKAVANNVLAGLKKLIKTYDIGYSNVDLTLDTKIHKVKTKFNTDLTMFLLDAGGINPFVIPPRKSTAILNDLTKLLKSLDFDTFETINSPGTRPSKLKRVTKYFDDIIILQADYMTYKLGAKEYLYFKLKAAADED